MALSEKWSVLSLHLHSAASHVTGLIWGEHQTSRLKPTHVSEKSFKTNTSVLLVIDCDLCVTQR